MNYHQLNPSIIAKIGVTATITALWAIRDLIRFHPERAFKPKPIRYGKKTGVTLTVDDHAEYACERYLYRIFRDQINVFGEERLKLEKPDLSKEQGLVAIADMVDGTDLLKRGLSNWCSALVFFYPSQEKILGAFVGIPSDGIYFATQEPGAYKKLLGDDFSLLRKNSIRLTGKSKIRSLKKASVCFYGQKVKRFLSVASKRKFASKLKTLGEKPETRIYNFAGNPMMVKLADGNVDAVFDLGGQYPHDVAPGAFIAMKAGAVWSGLKSQNYDIEKSLLKPAQRGPGYILASTKNLCKEIHSAIC